MSSEWEVITGRTVNEDLSTKKVQEERVCIIDTSQGTILEGVLNLLGERRQFASVHIKKITDRTSVRIQNEGRWIQEFELRPDRARRVLLHFN